MFATAPMCWASAASALASVCASIPEPVVDPARCQAALARVGSPVGADLSPENFLTNVFSPLARAFRLVE
jgi:hypothetical protein